ncbi:MAG: sulfurtransferase TusA family protein [Chloroflexota bacterium]
MDWAEVTIDVRGLSCPTPQVRALEALKKLGRGEVVVLMDERAACESVIRTARALGLAYHVQMNGQEFVVRVHKMEELWASRLNATELTEVQRVEDD